MKSEIQISKAGNTCFILQNHQMKYNQIFHEIEKELHASVLYYIILYYDSNACAYRERYIKVRFPTYSLSMPFKKGNHVSN